jgi:hypothetical protein
LLQTNGAGADPSWVTPFSGDHGALTGLSDDDHTIYALLAGRSGGQTLKGDTASGGNLTLVSTAHATKGQIILTGIPTSPGTGATSERFGASSAADGANSTAFGYLANVTANNSTALGYGTLVMGIESIAAGKSAISGASYTIAVGVDAFAGSEGGIAIGRLSTSGAVDSIALGRSAYVAHQSSIGLGRSVTSSAANQFVVGGSAASGFNISNVYIGSGVTDTVPADTTYNATGGVGTNIAGANLLLAAGKGTGSAVGGSIKLQSTIAAGSGTTLATLQDKWVMTNVGVMQGWQPSSTQDRQAFDITPTWATATDASRKALAIFNIWDTAVREAFRIEASGSAAMIGFLGAVAVARPAAYTQTYATATRTHANLTSADLTGITTSTTGSALAEPSASYVRAEMQQNFRRIQDQFNALRADLTNLKGVVNQIVDDQQAYGLFA